MSVLGFTRPTSCRLGTYAAHELQVGYLCLGVHSAHELQIRYLCLGVHAAHELQVEYLCGPRAAGWVPPGLEQAGVFCAVVLICTCLVCFSFGERTSRQPTFLPVSVF